MGRHRTETRTAVAPTVKRTLWVATFLTLTAASVGMELWAAGDHSPDTVPWTELIARNVPQNLTIAAITLLISWLPGHFADAYRKEGNVKVARYNKAWIAVAAAGLAAIQQLIPMSDTAHGWVSVGIAVLGAAGVYATPNAPQPPPDSVAALSRLRKYEAGTETTGPITGPSL